MPDEVIGKHEGKSRKADIMIIMRQLIKKRDELASEIIKKIAA
ncbi:MAG: hypothetical protein QF747_03165 [Patescibacteria group bacterium]|jgi:hypothetical protein|nr:hypothetical protein [Patescibacteria group bacterium]MDP6756340.1 hypothetical protein [Patescibacteria group bacterium]|tara:strand:+ start:7205 stop:7333 length:129 start_codon:yes stop_codon:yes gene_type:complete